jgi:hypothetical protein
LDAESNRVAVVEIVIRHDGQAALGKRDDASLDPTPIRLSDLT